LIKGRENYAVSKNGESGMVKIEQENSRRYLAVYMLLEKILARIFKILARILKILARIFFKAIR
jgi:hypothetical protein